MIQKRNPVYCSYCDTTIPNDTGQYTLPHIRNHHQKLDKELQSLRASLAEKDREIAGLRAQIDVLEKSIDMGLDEATKKILHQRTIEIQSLESSIATLKGEIERAKDVLEKLEWREGSELRNQGQHIIPMWYCEYCKNRKIYGHKEDCNSPIKQALADKEVLGS